MRKTILALTMAASVLALSACSDKSADDEIIATTKAGDITKEELYEEMKDAVGVQAFENLILKKHLKTNSMFQIKN